MDYLSAFVKNQGADDDDIQYHVKFQWFLHCDVSVGITKLQMEDRVS